MLRTALLAVIGALALGGGAARAERHAVGARSSKTTKKAKSKKDPLFPKHKSGWKHLSKPRRRAARRLAGDYVSFLAGAPTPRRAVTALTDLARAAGGVASGAAAPQRGGLYFFGARGGDAAAFFRPGARPVTDGMRVVVVSVDAPRIELKQTPVYVKDGFAMLQTRLHGALDWKSWMVHPLALHIYLDRGDGKPLSLSIGEAPGDPVLSIPDLLPHLADGIQPRGRPVTDPERLDALAARSRKALLAALAKRGVSAADFAAAEAYLIPATRPRLIGVDRSLVGGYGQSQRALAFAAVRALASVEPDRAAVVIALSRTASGGGGADGVAFVRRALVRIVDALTRGEADLYDTQRALSGSVILVGRHASKKQNGGLVLAPRSADALPAAAAGVLSTLRGGGVQVQIDTSRAGSFARDLATLDLDAIDIAVPTSGVGTPGELLSVLDLYQGYLGCRVFLRH